MLITKCDQKTRNRYQALQIICQKFKTLLTVNNKYQSFQTVTDSYQLKRPPPRPPLNTSVSRQCFPPYVLCPCNGSTCLRKHEKSAWFARTRFCQVTFSSLPVHALRIVCFFTASGSRLRRHPRGAPHAGHFWGKFSFLLRKKHKTHNNRILFLSLHDNNMEHTTTVIYTI